MANRVLSWMAFASAWLALAACTSQVHVDGGEAASDDASDSATSPGTPQAEAQVCGSDTCGPNEYCHPDLWSGCATNKGDPQCSERATECTDDYEPTCGCDGEVYDNACAASAAGVAIDFYASGSECTPPPGYFACRYSFCRLGEEVCNNKFEGSVSCVALPNDLNCGELSDCDCVYESGILDDDCWGCYGSFETGIELDCGVF